MGGPVAGAGDVNGDGYADVIVGAGMFDNGQFREGVAFVFLGSPSGIVGTNPATAAAILESDQDFAFMGSSVSGAGDVNGDGYADVIAGATQFNNGQRRGGAAFVFLGSPSGVVGTNPATAAAILDYMGRSVSGAGDVNGDGYADVIVGGWDFRSLGQPNDGAAFVFLGSPSGIVGTDPATAATMLESNQSAAHMGSSVSGAGDVNGDGYADVIVGAQWYDNGQPDEGAAFVFLGSPSGVVGTNPATAAAIIESNQGTICDLCNGSEFGSSVAGAGDVNGDGYADLIVGAPEFDNGQQDEGAAFLFLGLPSVVVGTNPATAATMLESDQDIALMGSSVSGAGDVNGDGYFDVIVGAPHFDNGQHDEGAAFVFLGSPSGVLGTNPVTGAAIIESDQDNAHMGSSVSGAGDVNGDGYADVVVGVWDFDNGQTDEGAAFVFLGSPSGVLGTNPATALAILESDQDSAHMGSSVSGAGDVNGDGYADLIVGAFDYGRGVAFVYLGDPSGVVGTNPVTAAAALRSDSDYAQMGFSVSGAGDVNGDGYADVIVGAPDVADGHTADGAAFVFLGSPTGIVGTNSATAATVLESNQEGAEMGHSVSGAGDVNGDGYADVVVGAPNFYGGQDAEGAAFVFLGSPTGIVGTNSATAAAVLESNQEGTELFPGSGIVVGPKFGFDVAGAGDLNGDGYAEVIVGAPRFNNGQLLEGAAFVFLGSPSGVEGTSPATAFAILESDQDGALMGESVSGAGDVNGDGYADAIVGAPYFDNGQFVEGAAFVFAGNSEASLKRAPRLRRADTALVATPGINQQTSDLRVNWGPHKSPGADEAGSVEWEIKPYGEPFDGTGTTTTWVNISTPDHAFEEPFRLNGETNGWHWRARCCTRR